MEARIAKLEASVEHIERDISDIKIDLLEIRKKIDHHLFYVLAALAAILGIMAKEFGWI